MLLVLILCCREGKGRALDSRGRISRAVAVAEKPPPFVRAPALKD